MATIIKVENGIVYVGTENGLVKQVSTLDLNFSPVVGEEVDIYDNFGKTMIAKKNYNQNFNMNNNMVNNNQNYNSYNNQNMYNNQNTNVYGNNQGYDAYGNAQSINAYNNQNYGTNNVQYPQSQDGKKSVNKAVYCLLAFFSGWIGVHKFYSGKIVAGVLYLLFFWTLIPYFISIIEFFIGVFKKADENGRYYI